MSGVGGEFELLSCQTGEIVGRLLADGSVVSDDPAVRQRVEAAFQRELLVRDGELIEELGVCFDGVETLRPGDPGHWRLVLRNLGILADVIPQRRSEEDG